MLRRTVFGLIVFGGCGEKRDPFPMSTLSADTEEEEEGYDDAAPTDCDDTWRVQGEGVVIQPEACIAWSPPSFEGMDWYAAASVEDGERGGCGSDCPEGDGYCATLSLDGRTNWRLPSLDELKNAALSQPEIPDVDGKLWSHKSGQGSTENAWVVDLGQPGLWLEIPKSDDAIGVRCVSSN